MKSAYEIAMGRLEKEAPQQKVDQATREALAQVDQEFDAKIAERKIFLESEIVKAVGDPAAVEQLRRQLSSEIARLGERRESEKEKIRSGSR